MLKSSALLCSLFSLFDFNNLYKYTEILILIMKTE